VTDFDRLSYRLDAVGDAAVGDEAVRGCADEALTEAPPASTREPTTQSAAAPAGMRSGALDAA